MSPPVDPAPVDPAPVDPAPVDPAQADPAQVEDAQAEDAGAASVLLEARYRFALRLLPASYRAGRADEMVSALLDGSGGVGDQDNPRPRWGEIASVAALAVRVRMGGSGATPRHAAWGDAVRLAALLGLGLQATAGWLGVGHLFADYGLFGAPSAMLDQVAGQAGSSDRLWNVVLTLTSVVWIAAFAAIVAGRTRSAKVLAVAAFAIHWAIMAPAVADVPSTLVHGLPPLVAVVTLLVGFHREAPRSRTPHWLSAVPLGVGVVAFLAMRGIVAVVSKAMTSGADTETPMMIAGAVQPWLEPTGLATLALLLAGSVWAARGPAARPLALALLVPALLCARSSSLNFAAADTVSATITHTSLLQLTLLAMAALAWTVSGLRALPTEAEPRSTA